MVSGSFINRSVFTPTVFPALAPHEQTEALLLAAEFGMDASVLAAAVCMKTNDIRAIMRAKHAYRLPDAAAAEREVYVAKPSNRHRIAALLFSLGALEKPVHLSATTAMSKLDIAHVSASRALRQMLTDRWIIMARPSTPTTAAAYLLTEIGAVSAGEAL